MTDLLFPDPPFSFDPSAFLNVGDDCYPYVDGNGADPNAGKQRGRKVPDELTKARNRIYARVNRQKKKEYVEELEIRVRVLEADNCLLRQQLQDTLRANEALQQQLTLTAPAGTQGATPTQAIGLHGISGVAVPQLTQCTLPALPGLTLPLLSPTAFTMCQPDAAGTPVGGLTQAGSTQQRPLGLFLLSVVSLFALCSLVPWGHIPHRANTGPVLIHSPLDRVATVATTVTTTGRRLLQQAERSVATSPPPSLPFVESTTTESAGQRAAAALVTVTPNLRIIAANATVLEPGTLPLLFLYVPGGFTVNVAARGASGDVARPAAPAKPRQLLIGDRTTQNASKQVAEVEVRETRRPEVLRRGPAPLLVDLVGCERAAQIRPDAFPHRQDTLRYIELLRRFERGEVALRSDIAEVIVRKVNEYCLMACRTPACSPKNPVQ
eukprot:TRINITY_DN151_c0_g1_i1.p1 TRINITY_DN151_c0_g1~~TRINITY_DN151_c0_g1_i1.p1  ORF type:complete len:438 (+),score=73.65 TRINITY_DN151_c0_g1_i1:132-1445(+)